MSQIANDPAIEDALQIILTAMGGKLNHWYLAGTAYAKLKHAYLYLDAKRELNQETERS